MDVGNNQLLLPVHSPSFKHDALLNNTLSFWSNRTCALLTQDSKFYRPPTWFWRLAKIGGIGFDSPCSARAQQGRRHEFLSGGQVVGRVVNLPQNTLKIGKNTGFWPLHSRIWGSTHPVFKSAGVRTPLTPPVGDAPGAQLYSSSSYICNKNALHFRGEGTLRYSHCPKLTVWDNGFNIYKLGFDYGVGVGVDSGGSESESESAESPSTPQPWWQGCAAGCPTWRQGYPSPPPFQPTAPPEVGSPPPFPLLYLARWGWAWGPAQDHPPHHPTPGGPRTSHDRVMTAWLRELFRLRLRAKCSSGSGSASLLTRHGGCRSLSLEKRQYYIIQCYEYAVLGGYTIGDTLVRGGRTTLPVTCGVPQGSIIGPIIFMLMTSDLPAHLTHGTLISYADDTLHIDSSFPTASSLTELQIRLELTMRELHAWFTSNSLKMNSNKTDFLVVGSKQNITKTQNFSFTADDISIQPSKTVTFLGVVIDPVLSWELHISHVVRKCNKILFSLYRFRHYFTSGVLRTLVEAYVFPHIVYCICVWGGASKGLIHAIQKLINFSARIVTGVKKHQRITPSLNSLDWPKIDALVARRDVTKVWRLLRTDGVPPNVRSLLVPRSAVSARETRGSDGGALNLQRCRLSSSQKAFSYRGAAAWNALPQHVRDAPTLSAFKAAISHN